MIEAGEEIVVDGGQAGLRIAERFAKIAVFGEDSLSAAALCVILADRRAFDHSSQFFHRTFSVQRRADQLKKSQSYQSNAI